MTDLSVLPSDLAALYADSETSADSAEVPPVEQLELQVDSAEHEFRRWLQSQPQPAFIAEAKP